MYKKNILFVALLFIYTISTAAGSLINNNIQSTKLEESKGLLVNPGKGWIIYGSDVSSYPQAEWLELCRTSPFKNISTKVWNLGSVVYLRYHWTDIEPKEGVYNWEILDNPIRLAQQHGKQFAFGVMSCNSCMSTQAIPQYVFDAGAKLVNVNSFDNINNKATVSKTTPFNDPVYLDKMGRFLKALGKRYDGNPTIAFFDVRSYGNFGENHIGSLNNMIPQISSDEFKEHVKMHKAAFKTTKLVTATSHIMRAFSTKDDPAVWQWCVEQGVGLRWDGYLFDNKEMDMIKATEIALKPAIGSDYGILECWQPYGQEKNYLNSSAWRDAILKTQSSLCSLANWGANGELFYDENRTFVEEISNLLGYHFAATAVSFDTSLMKGGKGSFSLLLSNKGAAPILIPATLKLALMDTKGTILETIELDKVNPSSWKPGESITVNASAKFRKYSGAASLAIGLFSKQADEKPDIFFGNAEVNKQGWLIINKKNKN